MPVKLHEVISNLNRLPEPHEPIADPAVHGGGEAADPVPTDSIVPQALHHHRPGEDRQIQRPRRGAVQRATGVHEAQAHTGVCTHACGLVHTCVLRNMLWFACTRAHISLRPPLFGTSTFVLIWSIGWGRTGTRTLCCSERLGRSAVRVARSSAC